MNKRINVGLIGFGIGGQIFYAPIITSFAGLILNKIRTTKPSDVASVKTKYAGTEIVSDTDEIINNTTIDLVVITTSNLTLIFKNQTI